VSDTRRLEEIYSESYPPSLWAPPEPPPPEPPTGVSAGAPGTFTPVGAEVPATIGDLRALDLLDADTDEAWGTDEYIVIGSGNVHWNGDDWAMGAAP